MLRKLGTSLAWCILLTALCGLLLPLHLTAQQATAKIVGSITDPAGAVVPGVRVTVTSTETSIATHATTDKDGFYEVINLPIGTYSIAAEKAGFKRLVVNTTPLEINQSLRVDLHLDVGATAEEVTVEAVGAGVETVNPTLGQSITSRPIVDLPLNGRNVLDLALLQPGVTESNPAAVTGGQAGTFGVSGGKSDSVTFLLDGGLNNDLLGNEVVFTPPPDSVAEFRILTSNYSAEYGRNASGIVSVVTKSGTNQLHGSVYDFFRNDALNANTFFNKQQDLPRNVLKRNQFGFTLGGPVVIPKVINGHDKFFWFASYTGQRQTDVETRPEVQVYTPAELQGNFSQNPAESQATVGGQPNAQYQAIANFLQANPYYQSNPALAAQGIIDPTKFSPVAQAYIKDGLIPVSASGFVTPHHTGKDNIDELNLKFDYQLTNKDKLSVTLGASREPVLNPFSFSFGSSSIDALGFGSNNNHHRYFTNASWDRTISNSILNEVRFTAQRINIAQAFPAGNAPTAAQLGIGITPDQATGPPLIGLNSGLTIGYSPQGPTTEINNTFAWTDTLSWIHGKHTMKYGFLFSPYQNNTRYDFYVNGEFYFYGGSPSGLNCIAGTCNDLADFLLGLPDEYLQFGSAPSNIRSKSWAGFAQDEWHVRKNLVLTYGLRYEYNSPKLDTQGRSFSIIPGAQSTRFVNAPTNLVFPGDPAAPRGANFPDRNNFAPRFGFAWDPTGSGKTSLRGGFGVFYDILKGEDNLQFNGQAPFFGYTDYNFNPLAGNPTTDPGYMTDPFGVTGTVNPFPSKPPASNIDFGAAGFLPFGGGGVYFVDPHLRTPYTYQYNLSVQHELPGRLTLETSYVGSITKKQTALVDQNPFALGTNYRLLNGPAASNFSYLLTFGNVVDGNYNSLQTSLTKQLTQNAWFGHTYFNLAYTWGKSIDNASGFRNVNSQVPYYNHEAFRSVSDYDVPHRIVFSGGWDLPFAHMWNGGPKRLTDGWSLYPIVTWRAGFPIDLSAGYNTTRRDPGPSGAGDAGLTRPDVSTLNIPTLNPKLPGSYWFNTSLFSAPADTPAGTYGTYPRNYLRGPSRGNFDLALSKMTPLVGERLKMEFRAEFFNILNHAEFQQPNTNFTSANFGQITSTYDPRIGQLALRFTF